MNFLQRQETLRKQLDASRFDALFITHLPNIRYLCGFTGSAGVLYIEEAGSFFFSDVRYDTQAREEVKGARVVIPNKSVLAMVKGEAQAFGEMDDWLGRRAHYSC
jgi:Xaa-Pro aminopeptidase